MPTDIQDALATLASAQQGLASTGAATAASALARASLAETISTFELDLQRVAADAAARLAELDTREQQLAFNLGRLAKVAGKAPAGVVAGGALAIEVAAVEAEVLAALGVDAAGLAALQATAAGLDDDLTTDVDAAMTAVEDAASEHQDALEDEEEAAAILREVEEELAALGAAIDSRYSEALELLAEARLALAAGDDGLAFVAWNDARRALASLAGTALDVDVDQLAAASLHQGTIDGGATPLGSQATAQWQAARVAYEAAVEVTVEKHIALVNARLALAQALAAQEVAMATRDEDLAAAIEAEVAGGGP